MIREKIDQRENRVEEKRIIEVEERGSVKKRLGKIGNTYEAMEIIESPRRGIGNKAKRFEFQDAEERKEDDTPNEEAGARGGLTKDEFQWRENDEEEDFS